MTEPDTRTADLAAEAALIGVSVALVVCSARLFRDLTFLGPLLIVVVTAHGCSIALRRLRVGALTATMALFAIGALVITWVYLWSTTWFGLPTTTTLLAVRDAMHVAFAGFRTAVAPVPVRPGFELALAVTLWTLATFADTAAFRGDAPMQAVAPHIGVFVASSIFARGVGAAWSTAVMVGAICFHLGANRAGRMGHLRWVQSEGRRGTSALLGGVASITAVAALVGAVAGPAFPGADAKAVVDLRSLGRGPGPIEVGNPLVGVSNLLGQQSDSVVFKVHAANPHYWRLTALERYDPADGQWKTRRSYRDVESGQPLPGSDLTGNEDIAVDIVDLPGIWMPTAFRPAVVTAPIDMRFDPDTESVIASGRTKVPTVSYDVRSDVSTVSPEEGANAGTGAPGIAPGYLEVPALSPVSERWLSPFTSSAEPKFQVALDLEARFRQDFTYDTSVDFSREPDPLGAFIVAKRGFCQQFASAFAVFARWLGIPSRVAVGFSWGDAEDPPDDQGRTVYTVRGRHAHAWPELYFDGLGWVAFEPTPGRGNPDAQDYSPVPPAQAAPGDSGPTTATTTTAATGGPGVTSTIAPGDPRLAPDVRNPTERSTASAAPSRWWRRVLTALVGVVGLALMATLGRLGWVAARRRRRTTAARTDAEVAELAWIEMCEWLDEVGLGRRAAETPAEYSARVVGSTGWSSVSGLAVIETGRRYGAGDIDGAEALEATRVATEIGARASSQLGRRGRWARRLALRPSRRPDASARGPAPTRC